MVRSSGWFSPNALVLGVVLMGFSGMAAAQPSLIGTTTDPTGIAGLQVGATLYNVAFSIDSYDALFTGTANPPVFQNSPDVFLTQNALGTFFTSNHVTGLAGGACGTTQACVVFVPSSLFNSGGVVTTNGAGIVGGAGGWNSLAGDPGLEVTQPVGNAQPGDGNTYYEYAVFTPETGVHGAPEIDPSGATAALTLLLGMLTVVRGRRADGDKPS